MLPKTYIDTNVFLRFLVLDKENPHLNLQAKLVFSKLQSKKIILLANALVIAEIVYVMEKYYKISKENIKNILLPLLSVQNLLIKNKDLILAAINLFADKNVDFEDAYTYLEMLDEEVFEIFTFDIKHFNRLEGINIKEIN